MGRLPPLSVPSPLLPSPLISFGKLPRSSCLSANSSGVLPFLSLFIEHVDNSALISDTAVATFSLPPRQNSSLVSSADGSSLQVYDDRASFPPTRLPHARTASLFSKHHFPFLFPVSELFCLYGKCSNFCKSSSRFFPFQKNHPVSFPRVSLSPFLYSPRDILSPPSLKKLFLFPRTISPARNAFPSERKIFFCQRTRNLPPLEDTDALEPGLSDHDRVCPFPCERAS